jgi:hypothetical protein
MLLLLMLLFLFLIELHKIVVVVWWLILLLVLRFFSVCVGSYWHCSFFLIFRCCLLLILCWCWSCCYGIRKKVKILLYFLFNAWYGCCCCWLPFLVFLFCFLSLFFYFFYCWIRLFRCFVAFCYTSVLLRFPCIYFLLWTKQVQSREGVLKYVKLGLSNQIIQHSIWLALFQRRKKETIVSVTLPWNLKKRKM